MHPAWTYTLQDLAGAAWGTIVFAAALVAPGYCLAHLCDPLAFRTRAFREQIALSVALSFGPGVLLLVAVVAVGGALSGALFLFATTLFALWLLRAHRYRSDLPRRQLLLIVFVASAWAVIVLASLVDIGTHNQLWMSVTSYDHGLRTAFVDAVLRTGLPPVDPVYWPGHDTSMRYYYFWYAVCASVARLAHISARQALIASCVWPAAGIVAMLALFARHVLNLRARELTRTIVVSAALLGVCGLDVLVTLALHLLHTPVLPDMEWWAIDQVASWPDTFLWVPHHAAALVAALLGLLLIQQASAQAEPSTKAGERLKLSILAGLSLAAAFGMSAYIAVATALVLAAWLIAGWRSRERWQALALAALTSAVTLIRFLWQLTRHDGPVTRSASPLYLGVREILSPVVLADSSLLHSLALCHPWRAHELAAAILLVPSWGVELGFFAVILLLALMRFRQTSTGERTLLGFTLSGLAASSFLRSGVIATNDYGIRAALLPQFFLLLLGALVFVSSRRGARAFLWLLIAVGAAGCTYQLVLLRAYLQYQQAHGNPDIRDVGERTYALREAYAALPHTVPALARIQFDPAATSFYLYPHLLFAHRQLITAEITCSTSFGGDPGACPGIQNGINRLFPAKPIAVPTSAQARQLCSSIGAEYLVVTRWDVASQASDGWAWTLPSVVAQPSVRIVACT